MAYKSTNFPGVRYREHPTRKHGVRFDRYFTIRYQVNGKRHEEGLGWASQGWSAARALEVLSELKKAQRVGEGPQTLRERRKRKSAQIQAEKVHQEAERRELFTFGELAGQYLEWAKTNKRSWLADEQRYRVHLAGPLRDKPLKSITSLDLERLKRNLKKTLAPASVKHCLVLVRQMFNKAVIWGLYNC